MREYLAVFLLAMLANLVLAVRHPFHISDIALAYHEDRQQALTTINLSLFYRYPTLNPTPLAFSPTTILQYLRILVQDSRDTESTKDKHTLKCAGYGGAYPEGIWDGIQHLRRTHGQPRNGAGPGNCGRVACRRGGAILWCNGDLKPRSLPSFNNIADGAQTILDGCNRGYRRGFGGVLAHPDLWKVVVRYEKC
ncbi:hypothetical protein BJX70DRAFT_404294 [Aspergillus crustosus]